MKYSPLLSAFAVLLAATPLAAADYFVATNGSDNASGLSATTPFRTLSRSAALVSPGDTVTVAAGTYNEVVTIIRPGTAAAPIVFRSATRAAARINGAVSIRSAYIEFTGFDVSSGNSHGINLVGHHLRIANNDVHDCSGNGISAFASDYLTIEDNRLFRNGLENRLQASGIAIYQPVAFDQAPGFHIVIRRNQTFDNESRVNTRENNIAFGHGILLDDFRSTADGFLGTPYRPATLVENNLLYNNVGRAIVVANTDNVLIRHNTAWGNLRIRNVNTVTTSGTFTSQDTDSVRWFNNIVSARGFPDVAVFELRTTNGAWDHNLIWNGATTFSSGATAAGMGGRNLFADPRLINPTGGNFRPGPGSLALDEGSSAQAAAADFEGSARPRGTAADIGAFEMPAETTPPSGPPVFAAPLANQTLLAGNFATLVGSATGALPLSYQWSRNGQPIAGATNRTLTFAPVSAADNGSYTVTVRNSAGSISSAAASVSVASTPTFVWRAPLPQGGTLHGVAFGAGKFIAVGLNGRVLTSDDAVSWTLTATLPTTALLAIGFDGFQWVAAGNAGTLFTSRDGVDWTQRNASTTNTLRSVATVNNSWVVCGDAGTIITSLDGVNWSVRNTGVTQTLNAITGTTGRYVAAGQAGTLLTSSDTLSWTRVTPAGLTGEIYAAGYFNNQFVIAGASGMIYASPDGSNWNARTSPANGNWLRALAHDGTRFVFMSDGDRVVVTPDLASYTNVTMPSYNATAPRWGVAYGAGKFVAVGAGGEISRSPDGINWTSCGAIGARWTNHNVGFFNGQWLAASSVGGILTSPDGVTWTRQTSPTTAWLRGVAHGLGRYVVAGDAGWILSSTNAISWAGQSASGTTQNLTAVAFTNGRFVAVGNGGAIVTSTDGTTWTAAASGVTTALQNVVTFHDRFYAVGANGVILVSSDGTNWNSIPSGTTQTLFGIAHDGNTLFIVGTGRTILASSDGQSWTPRTPPALNNGTYRGITPCNGGWLIVGDTGVALFSLDGISWNFLPTLAEAEALMGVASNGRSTVAIGNGGTIIQAHDPVVVPTAGAPGFAQGVASQNILTGGYTTLVADASGSPPFTYQWNKDGSPIPGATNARLSFGPAKPQDAGLYSVTIANAAGRATSNAAALTVTPLPTFAWRNPSPEGGTLQCIAYANGRFVAVGTGSRILTSPDGNTWTLAATLPTAVLFGVASDGLQWIAVGNNGALFTSFDTINWAQRNPGTTVNLRSVTSTGTGFIASGDNGTVTVSSDGVTWTSRSTGATQILWGIASAGGRTIAVGQAGTLLTSGDAVTWTRVPLTTATGAAITGDLNVVAFVNGQFVAAGNGGVIVNSPDGVTWAARNTTANTNTIRGLAYSGSQFVFVTDGDRVVTSQNLSSYTNVTMPAYNLTAPRWSVAYGAGQFVTVGSGGEVSASTDGSTWTQRGAANTRNANFGIAYLNDLWIATGTTGGIMTSPDGMTWTRQTTPIGNWLRSVAYGLGRYVVVGDQGWIISSTNAVTWTGTQAASTTTQSFSSVTFANNRFVAVGANGVIVTSNNGTSWTPADSGVTLQLTAVGVFRDRFYAVGNTGLILTSDNGTSWSRVNSGTTQNLLGLGTDGDMLYVVGSGRTILASTDGASWVPRTAPPLNNSNYRGIARANSGWIIVGDQGVGLFSIDGINWEFLPTLAAAETLNAIAANSFGVVATGSGAAIIQALNAPFGKSRLTNVATRGFVPAGGSLTPGFVMRGAGMKNVVVRAVGPTLASFGLDGLSDLRFDLINQQTNATAASNDDWGGNTALTNAFAALGAFPLQAISKDAAVQAALPVNSGGYSIRVVPTGGASTGVALAEVYDADGDDSPVRLINVSTLGFVGNGDNVLTPGFVIRGTGAKLVLIRAVGPGLIPLGVGGVLADPQFTVYSASNAVAASNNDWGSTAALKETFLSAGAFALPDGSKDAAAVVMLPPGAYTVVTSGVGNTTGTALVEVYDLDP